MKRSGLCRECHKPFVEDGSFCGRCIKEAVMLTREWAMHKEEMTMTDWLDRIWDRPGRRVLVWLLYELEVARTGRKV
jgi:hypothetical protein